MHQYAAMMYREQQAQPKSDSQYTPAEVLWFLASNCNKLCCNIQLCIQYAAMMRSNAQQQPAAQEEPAVDPKMNPAEVRIPFLIPLLRHSLLNLCSIKLTFFHVTYSTVCS